jgi:hypothetical protein
VVASSVSGEIFVIDELDLVVVITSEWWDQASLDAAYGQAFSLLDDWIAPAVAPWRRPSRAPHVSPGP